MATVFKQVQEQTWEEKLAELEAANASPEEIAEAKAAFEDEFGIVEPVQVPVATVENEKDEEEEEGEVEEEDDGRNSDRQTQQKMYRGQNSSREP